MYVSREISLHRILHRCICVHKGLSAQDTTGFYMEPKGSVLNLKVLCYAERFFKIVESSTSEPRSSILINGFKNIVTN